MSTKERLHQLVDEMNDDQADELLERLEFVAPPLSEEDRASIERGRAQARAGQLRTTEEVFASLRTRA
ncbi:MAG: hypothetical protein U0837_17265 [Dehalococcoidia bacterium]|jgi:predicted transcriptional regulator